MNTLRQRAWWLIRQQRTFTLNDLLTTLCDGSEKNAYHSLMKYVVLLERVGVLQRLKRKAPGLSKLSRGHVIWRLIRDLGRMPPVARYRDTVVFDPNSQVTLTEQLADGPIQAVVVKLFVAKRDQLKGVFWALVRPPVCLG